MATTGRDRGAPTADQEFARLTIDTLRPLAARLGSDPPKKKGELVAALTGAMTDPARVRTLYDRLGRVAQLAVREAAHDPDGHYSRTRFVAKHGREPDWSEPSPEREYGVYDRRRSAPTSIVLFFPGYEFLPADVRAILLRFVPPPDPFTIPTNSEPPAEHLLVRPGWDKKRPAEAVPVRVREQARRGAQCDERADRGRQHRPTSPRRRPPERSPRTRTSPRPRRPGRARRPAGRKPRRLRLTPDRESRAPSGSWRRC